MPPVRTALFSFGMSGRVFHAPFIATTPHYEFSAVLERSKKTAADIYPSVTSYSTPEELLKDERIELVIVNTPNYTHYDYVKIALQAGKHVVVEKPFTTTVEEADELMALANKTGKKLSVYHNRRWDSDCRTIRRVLDQHLLGDIREAEFHFDRYSEVLSPKLHKEIPGPGTGIVYDLGSHLIDQALQSFGSPQAVFGDIFALRPVSKVDDYMEILLYYHGFRVRIRGSYQVRETLPAFVVHGSKGSFIKPKGDLQEAKLQAGEKPDVPGWGEEAPGTEGLLHTDINGTVVREPVPSEKGNYGEYYELLYQSIRHDAPLPVNASEAREVIDIIQKAYQSNKEGKIIELA